MDPFLPACTGPTVPPQTALLLFFHGGGWMIGSVEVSDRPLRRLANDSGVSVLSVEYRLAPENRFPDGFDDCFAALDWASRGTPTLGWRPSFIAVGGDSAGANLAAAVAQRARDESGPSVDHQLLVYPVVSPCFDTPSYERFAHGYFLTRATMQYFWREYLGDDGETAPRYANLLATDSLAGLPSADVITCELDPLCSEGEDYARRLSDAGVDVSLTRHHGLIHGVWNMDVAVPRAQVLAATVAGAVRNAVALRRSRGR